MTEAIMMLAVSTFALWLAGYGLFMVLGERSKKWYLRTTELLFRRACAAPFFGLARVCDEVANVIPRGSQRWQRSVSSLLRGLLQGIAAIARGLAREIAPANRRRGP